MTTSIDEAAWAAILAIAILAVLACLAKGMEPQGSNRVARCPRWSVVTTAAHANPATPSRARLRAA